MKVTRNTTAMALALLLGAQAASATTVTLFTDRAAFDAETTTELEDFNGATDGDSFADAPLVVGDLTLETSGDDVRDGARNSIDAPPAQFATFDIDGTTIANVLLNDASQTFTIGFAEAITAFGADFGSLNDDSERTSITVAGEVFEPSVLPSVSDADRVSFIGFISDTAFTSVTFSFFADNDGFGVDNVAYGSADLAPIPLPATLPLLLAGFGGLAVLRRRKT